MRELTITPVLNGFIVRVGCQTIVFNDMQVLADELVAYQRDSHVVEKEYFSKAVNKSSIQVVPDELATPTFTGTHTYNTPNAGRLAGENLGLRQPLNQVRPFVPPQPDEEAQTDCEAC
jgi:hypothetical protein